MIEGLEITEEQFVDVCILCGCDYAGTIPRIGPATALKLVRRVCASTVFRVGLGGHGDLQWGART